jgi:hypothetical protein
MNTETTSAEQTNTESTSAVTVLCTAPKPKSQRRPHRSKITNLPEAIQSLVRQRDDRLDVIRHKAGIGRKTGPNELARQSVKDAFNLSDSWFNKPETQQQQHSG